MIDHATLVSMMSAYGMWVLTPLAVIEGPIVTVIAGYLANRQILSLWQVIPCVILADMLGDGLFYGLGRLALDSLSPRWRRRLGLTAERLEALIQGFKRNGTRILVAAKLTHAAGFAALTAAGAARMPFGAFLLVNTLAGIPKCLFFVALGYLFGSAYETIARWMSGEAAVLMAVLVLGAATFVFVRHKRAHR